MAWELESIPDALSERFKQSHFKHISVHELINRNLAEQIIEAIYTFVRSPQHHPLQPKLLCVSLHSRGGSLYEALRIVEALQRASRYCTVSTVADTSVYSSAVPIFLAGEPGFRFASRHAVMLIHPAVIHSSSPLSESPPSLGAPENQPVTKSAQQQQQQLHQVHRLQKQVDQLLLDALPSNALRKEFLEERKLHQKQEWYLDAETLLHYGLVDHLEVPVFTHQIQYRPRLVVGRRKVVSVPLKP